MSFIQILEIWQLKEIKDIMATTIINLFIFAIIDISIYISLKREISNSTKLYFVYFTQLWFKKKYNFFLKEFNLIANMFVSYT